MNVISLPEPTTTDAADDDVVHYFCCDEDLALCGIDLSTGYLDLINDDVCKLCEFVLEEVGLDTVCIGGCAFVKF